VVRVSQDPRTGLDSSVEQDPGVGRPTRTAEMPGACRRTVRERRNHLESRGFQVARRAIEPTSPPQCTANRKRRAAASGGRAGTRRESGETPAESPHLRKESVGVRNRRSSHVPGNRKRPMPELRRPPGAAGSGRNAATDSIGGRHAAHQKCSNARTVGTKLPRIDGRKSAGARGDERQEGSSPQ